MSLFDSIIYRQPIDKGWSGDKKYSVILKDGRKFLLRISSVEQYEKKKNEFELMTKVAELGIPMCEPIEFGITEEGVYSLQGWIDGVDAESEANNLSESDQYFYGLEAGRILKQIHTIPAPDGMESWDVFFNRKIDRKIEMYEKCPLKYSNGQLFIDYVNSHRHLLNGRPRVYQHGDYHVGNMMIGSDRKLYIIDFNRNDFGDPWEEFNRIVWCAQAMPLFAKGMVNGYFDNDVPIEFWKLLTLYICSNTLSSLPWAIPFGDDEIKVMINQANDVLSWYDNLNNPIPSWFK
ncbi:MAG: phosphotransferase [Clostridia bacterium]|nr:phosphotransferase [Clostridia bacterium]